MTEPTHASAPHVRSVEIRRIRANAHNPNRMTKRQLRELAAEIEHLGTLPHPIVIRPVPPDAEGVEYEIVDGEHRYRAARKLGHDTVPCVIVSIDLMEAMRQTYKRNRGGKDSKVLLGRQFRAMQQKMAISRRKFSKVMVIPEATIRIVEEYAHAEEVRRACAPGTSVKDIDALTHRQVDMYLTLQPALRDTWLDSGADVNVFCGCRDEHWTEVASRLKRCDLARFAKKGRRFRGSLEQLNAFAVWLTRHDSIAGILEYVHAAVRHDYDVSVMNALPYSRAESHITVAISREDWQSALRLAATTASRSPSEPLLDVSAAVRTVLAGQGIDLADVLGPAIAEDYQVVSCGPEFLRNAADCLNLSQQRWLTEIDAACDLEIAEAIIAAKEATVDAARQQGRMSMSALRETYDRQREYWLGQSHADPAVDHDPAAMLAAIIAEKTGLGHAEVGTSPAIDVLRVRLDAMPAAEFNLLLRAVDGDLDVDAGQEWLDGVAADADVS